MSTEPQIEAYRDCTRRVCDWFVSELTETGMIGNESDLIAYYHAPNLLAACDHAA